MKQCRQIQGQFKFYFFCKQAQGPRNRDGKRVCTTPNFEQLVAVSLHVFSNPWG